MKKFCLIILLLILAIGVASASVKDQMADAVKQYFVSHRPEWSDCRIEVEFPYAKDTFSKIEKKNIKNMYFRVAQNYSAPRITPKAILPISIYVDGAEQDRINLFVKANVYKDILVAADKISKGDSLSDLNVRLEERDVSMVPSNYFTDKAQLSGKVTQYLVRKGAAVFDWMVKTLPDVSRGDLVKIHAQAPGVSVVTTGKAMEEGKIGDRIRVKRKNVKTYLEATIISSGEVEVRI